MLYFKLFRETLTEAQFNRFGDLKATVAANWSPLLRPALEAPAAILGLSADALRQGEELLKGPINRGRFAVDGEIFTDARSLVVLFVRWSDQQVRRGRPHVITGDVEYSLNVAYIGGDLTAPILDSVVSATNTTLAISLQPYTYTSRRFDELKSEGRESPSQPTEDKLIASRALQDRAVRTLAVAIKASGGLLVRDLPKQLPTESRANIGELISALKNARLVESEIVIVCTKTQAQIARSPTRDIFPQVSAMGVRCACGRALVEEQTEEALSITDLGRGLLDKSRWLTVLVVDELSVVGVSGDSVLVEQQVGGDEIDCVANISGDLALFELKDKEFNLGNAYSFGAKIGIIRPKHPVVVSTEHVGNDAKEHFVRARLAGASSRETGFYPNVADLEEDRSEIAYIEGVNNLHAGIERLVSSIYRNDAKMILNQVLPLASVDAGSLVQALEVETRRNTFTERLRASAS